MPVKRKSLFISAFVIFSDLIVQNLIFLSPVCATEERSKSFSDPCIPHNVKNLIEHFRQLNTPEVILPTSSPIGLTVSKSPPAPKKKESLQLKEKLTEEDILFSWLNIQDHPLATRPTVPVIIFDHGSYGLEQLSHVIVKDPANIKEFEATSTKFYSFLNWAQYENDKCANPIKHGTRVVQIFQHLYQGPTFYVDFHRYHFNLILQHLQKSGQNASLIEINGFQFTAQEIDDFSHKFETFGKAHRQSILKYVDQIQAPIISISLSYTHLGGIDFVIDLIKKGKVVVIAAGNHKICPKDLENHIQVIEATKGTSGRLILVGASKLADIFVLYSKFSLEFDDTTAQCGILAPGMNVFLKKKIKSKGSYIQEKSKYLDGTSYAAPLTAAVIANLVAEFPQIPPPYIADILLRTAQKHDFWGRTLNIYAHGQGILDYDAAYEECQRQIINNA